MEELKSDLLAAKEEITAFQTEKKESSLRRPASLLGDADGAESGSDYGDWENDDWSVDSFAPPSSKSKTSQNMPPNKKTTQQTRGSTRQSKSSAADEDSLVSEKLGGASRQPTVASGWDEDSFTPEVSC
ncbi:uncharacterized protein LOC110055079 [Orbicella faveolata]|nr:uncharacterized protein LOC110055079 [Orbicella faveolata]